MIKVLIMDDLEKKVKDIKKVLIEGCGLKVHRTYKYNGIARSPFKQFLKDLLIPKRFSYHFIYILKNSANT